MVCPFLKQIGGSLKISVVTEIALNDSYLQTTFIPDDGGSTYL
jgi:hypothetical protein